MNSVTALPKPVAKSSSHANCLDHVSGNKPFAAFGAISALGRTVRLCRPLSYVGLLLTQGFPWSLLAALVAPTKRIAAFYLLAYLILRFAMAWTVGIWGVRDEVLRRKIGLYRCGTPFIL